VIQTYALKSTKSIDYADIFKKFYSGLTRRIEYD
jgi:hypothetical protein